MHTTDGSAGGGQVVRSALTLAGLRGEPVRIENVRGARSQPGLKPQHLAAGRLLSDVCGARVEGMTQGSETVVFDPTEVAGGAYAVDVGTAGAVTLVLDAVFPLAARVTEPLTVTVTGGTDVRWAPTVDYYRRVKLPLLRRVGLDASLTVDRRGFYPAGGGRVTLTVEPWSPRRLSLTERGALVRCRVDAVASAGLRDAGVGERIAQVITRTHPAEDCSDHVDYAESPSPGASVLLTAEYEDSHAGFSALGERGVPAETVGERALEQFERFDDGPGVVDEHMADQLLLPLALAGGRVRAARVTDHVRTNCAVLETFGVDLRIEERPEGVVFSCAEPVRL